MQMVPTIVACAAGCILVVDDDEDVREGLREHLESLGCSVVLAADGLEGLDALERMSPGTARPCLVLVDMNMPRLDGAGFVACVRTRQSPESLPIVAMSAESRRLDASIGCEHLAKPFDPTEITRRITRSCRGRNVASNQETPPDPANSRQTRSIVLTV